MSDTIDVPERAQATDITLWLIIVQKHVGQKHHELNPTCLATHCDVAIPLDKDKQVGKIDDSQKSREVPDLLKDK